jgi:hypothetical protein
LSEYSHFNRRQPVNPLYEDGLHNVALCKGMGSPLPEVWRVVDRSKVR